MCLRSAVQFKVLIALILALAFLFTGHVSAYDSSFEQLSSSWSQYEHQLSIATSQQLGTTKFYGIPSRDRLKLPYDLDIDGYPGISKPPPVTGGGETKPSKIPPQYQPYRRVEPGVAEEVLNGIHERYPSMDLEGILHGTLSERDACKDAIRMLDDAEKEKEKEEKKEDYLLALKKFDEKCLERIPAFNPSNVEIKAYKIVGIIGAIDTRKGDGIRDIWGVATYTGDGKIVTARHCIFHEDRKVKKARRKEVSKGNVLFQRISNPSKTYKVSFAANTNYYADNSIENDVLQLNIDQEIPDVKKPRFNLPPGIGTELTKLLVMGPIEYTQEESQDSGAWVERMRKGKLGGCVIENVTDNCLTHSCITDWRFSGTPMIRFAEVNAGDGIEILGLHTERGGKEGCPSQLGFGKKLNAGISSERISILTDLIVTN
uniref:Trypsin-like peptidase domain-containing protein n=1 Tax=Candidatus Kentrum eta TaxID=2126337 RepID=A0A450V732_9GAMM|nr:MAG: hypothetical protein BECKH772A_GA0070896_101943 [Candidatus Kentron sp. H]VFK00632.1 MAG: hypothetical protein BECKH772B_GA0070898_101973 [Candidatus Kentron sp. H]VFK04630.1 MAG: hypothetical protein BECKH772C_GA0070978_101943 [Candidatus Kentron sp. H]